MSVYVRLAEEGEELALAEVHFAAFSVPGEASKAFTNPNYANFQQYSIARGEKKYAKLIKERSVACAVSTSTHGDAIIGLAAWRLPQANQQDQPNQQTADPDLLTNDPLTGRRCLLAEGTTTSNHSLFSRPRRTSEIQRQPSCGDLARPNRASRAQVSSLVVFKTYSTSSRRIDASQTISCVSA